MSNLSDLEFWLVFALGFGFGMAFGGMVAFGILRTQEVVKWLRERREQRGGKQA